VLVGTAIKSIECMHFNPYFSCTVYPAKVGIKIHALSLCFVSAACFSAFLLQSLLILKISNFYYPCICIICTGCDGTVKGLDLVFVLDSSISIRRNRFELIRDLTKQISAELNISIDDSLVGVILISSKSTLHFSLNDHTNNSALRKALDEVPYLRSRTNTAAALRLLYNSALDGRLGIREGFPRVAIIVTDGLSDDVNATVRASEELHKLRIFTRVYAVGIEGAKIRELNTIASDPSFVAFTADFTPEGVEEVQQNVSLEVCIEENSEFITRYLKFMSCSDMLS